MYHNKSGKNNGGNVMIEKTTRLNLLYDFYKNLLTQKQQHIFELYFQDDLSFGEISEELDISRQAVNDTLRRTEAILLEYEEKLSLAYKYEQRLEAITNIRNLLPSLKAEDRAVIESIVKQLEDLD